jgi:nitrous oxidase accessory protein
MRLLGGMTALLLGFAATAQPAALHVGSGQAYASVRAAFARAGAGDTVYIHPGFYAEGNLVIDKPLTVIGIGYPVLDGAKQSEILTVTASDVAIHGLQLQNTGQLSTIDVAAVKVLSAGRVTIEDNRVYDATFGIYLSNTTECRIRRNDIRGVLQENEITSGNGIHLWKCSDAVIEENTVQGQRDGIYFEFVTESEIHGNYSHGNLRYGLHFMFSNNDRYHGNRFERNGAGVAVMFSHHVEMQGNEFRHNWGASSYGLLLKEIADGTVIDNTFEQNSAGVYMEGTSRMRIERNTFRENGWALRVQASCNENTITENNFFGNTFDVATNGHLVLNTFDRNYWDKYEGYDLNRDGHGDVPFRPVNLYAMVVEKMPYGLLLIRSFMVYLLDRAEKILPSLTPERLQDQSPLMKPFRL